jgi:signal transduction histidine kinase
VRGGAGRAPARPRRSVSLKVLLGGVLASALVLPLVLVLVFGYLATASAPRGPLLKLEYVAQELARAIAIGEGGVVSPKAGFAATPGLRLVVAGPDDRAVMSSSEDFAPGSAVSIAAISEAVQRDTKDVNFFAETVTARGAVVGRYYAWFDEPFVPARPAAPPIVPIVLIALGSLAFGLGTFVAARLGRSVLRLERAAGRMAAGDLESSVSVKGVREIESLAFAMDGMRVSLGEDRDRRARFLAAVSHDLRTPLTSIGGYLEAIDDGLADDGATLKRYVGVMRDKARILEGRIAGLLEFARIETGEWRMRFEETELRPFLERLCGELGEDAALSGRRLASELGALGGLRVRVDKTLLARAFENIVSNAIRFSPEGGLVTVSAARERGGPGCYVLVDDRGPGIAPEDRERVFEPFFRSAQPGDSGGSGLGLYIAMSVINGHGWELRAEEAPGGGGRISVFIPASGPPGEGGIA